MNKRRLLKLADLLEKDARNKKGVKFDLDQWGETEKARKFVKVDCNTQACAIGLACVSGAFKREGLTYDLDNTGRLSPEIPNPNRVDPFATRTLDGWPAVTTFFDINDRDARRLFNPIKGRPTKGAAAERAVAKDIRKFVAEVEAR